MFCASTKDLFKKNDVARATYVIVSSKVLEYVRSSNIWGSTADIHWVFGLMQLWLCHVLVQLLHFVLDSIAHWGFALM